MIKRVSLPDRALARVRQLVDEHGFSHEALAPHLGVGSSAVSKLLNGVNALGLEHIEGFCVAFQMTPSELFLEPGSLIQPLTPTEAQLLYHFRRMTDVQRMGLMAILDYRTTAPARTRRRARLGRLELTDEQQLLVDLYADSEPQAKKGVMNILRGTARKDDGPRHVDNSG